MNNKDLCLKIAKSESSSEVQSILKKNGLWDSIDSNWRNIGGIPNFNTQSVVGNQQAQPTNALVEKLVNCGDSALILNCKQKKIGL